LRQRLEGERQQIERVRGALARRIFVIPWQAIPPVGLAALRRLA
jgi:arsenite-transporting ATPase